MNNIICIAGPTASGKTALAATLAKELNGEVVSCDSMQVYKRMDIGTAKPTLEEMQGIPHHMIDVAEPWEDFSVSRYCDMAAPIVDDILSRGKTAVIAGGTGLYMDSLIRGNAFAPFPATGVRERLGELTAAGGETMPGLTTGFSDVDRKINGLNKSDLLLLAGRPGMGKTSMGLNVAVNAAKASRKTVAVFSLEMSREQLVTRLLAGEGLIDNTRLVTGNLRESDWVRIAEGASTLSRLDIRIDDNPLLTVADMNAKCRRLDDLGLVVIDYLQLMTSAGGKGYSGENRQQAVSDISRMLKIMAKELQVPVLCLSQLSRANEKRDDKRPMLSDLRESGAIEQDADIVMFLYRDDYYNSDSEKRNIAECIVAKNRHGETGKVELRWLPEYTSFGTLENRYQEEG